MATGDTNTTSTEERATTAPESFCISVRGLGDEALARALGTNVGAIIRELSRFIDLSRLDGVTVAGDYPEALAELDRGFPSTHILTPSDGDAIGLAMSPSVLREGELKTHIVLHATVVGPLADLQGGMEPFALQTIAHECAHVEVTGAFEDCFPGVLLRTRYPDFLSNFRWQVILACWDEYAATAISAPWGEDPTEGYEQTFLTQLRLARMRANEHIKAYRLHGDLDRLLAEVFEIYGDLLKFAAYHLGNMAGRGLAPEHRAATVKALEGHWFKSYFGRLSEACSALADGFGQWTDQTGFEAIGDLVEEMVREGGLIITRQADGALYVDVPFTPDTMPDPDQSTT